MWRALAFGSAFFAGITAILAKAGVKRIDSNLATAVRTIVILIFASLIVFASGLWPGFSNISNKTYLFLTLSGIATGGSWLFYFKALQSGTVSQVMTVDKSSTLLSMLLAFIFSGEAFTWTKGVGMAGIGLGTWLMIDRKTISTSLPTQRNPRGWFFYAALSAVFAALTSLLSKVGLSEINSAAGTAYRTGVVLVMAWVVVFVTGKQSEIKKIDLKSAAFLLLSGVTTGLSWLCFNSALANGPAAVVVPVDKLSVLLTVLFSRLFLKEKLTVKTGSGLALLTAGTLVLLIQ